MSDTTRTEEFPRSFEALKSIFRFIGKYFADQSIDELHRFSTEFAVEEIFTNMVKYHPEGRRPIRIELTRDGDLLRILLVDRGVDPYDIDRAPQTDTESPLEKRTPGGLGLQLTRKMMDSVTYAYSDRTRRITLTKRLRKLDVRD